MILLKNTDHKYFVGLLKDFKNKLSTDENLIKQMDSLREEVQQFGSSFPMPGLDLQ